MPKVSVIIPVYNAKDYLRRCLDSVCNQTLKDIEIICVNDCSTDNSIDILNEYAAKYPNMKVIDCKVNGGESVARNIGLDNAIGEYLGFVDNDDEIDLDFYEKLYTKAKEEGADIAKGEVHIIGYDKKETYSNLNRKIREHHSLLYFTYHWWTAIFKTSIIKENHINFIVGYPLGGDVLFLNKVVLASDTIALVDDAFYHYYRREDSGNSKILSCDKIHSVLTIHEMIVEDILNSNIKNNIEDVFLWHLKSALTYCFRCESNTTIMFCAHKAYSIYQKVKQYIPDENSTIFPVCMHIFRYGDEEKLKRFLIQNHTPQKMFLANLRFSHQRNCVDSHI